MAVALRMQRHGAKRRPFYHIVATDSRNPRDGRYLDQVGIYDPRGDKTLALNEEKVQLWVSRGAKPSGTVKRLIARAGIVLGAKGLQESPAEVSVKDTTDSSATDTTATED